MHRVIGIVILAISLVGGWYLWEYQIFKQTRLNITDSELLYRVPSGSSIRSIAQDLERNGTIKSARYFEWMARLSALPVTVKVGEYAIAKGTTTEQLLNLLVAGKVKQYTLTLVEGWNIYQVLDAVSQNTALEKSLGRITPAELMDRLQLDAAHPEGRFFPDTYQFPRGTTDVQFLQRAFQRMDQVLTSEWEQRMPNLPYASPYEALVMASIIEKETGLAAERGQIAGVFVRRLIRGMRLQTDPTVIYGLGEDFDGNIRRRDLRRSTPYNTYVIKGLPPTPIAMPGRAAIHAALHPEAGESLYFVARGDGSHHFSATVEEHNAAVDRYQRKRRNKRR